jgi:hypothetical protein
MKKTYEELSNFLNQSFDELIQKQNNMNTVTFYKHYIEFKELEFLTEKEAVDCMLRHASAESLEVNDDYTEAFSGGNIPELLIIVNAIK